MFLLFGVDPCAGRVGIDWGSVFLFATTLETGFGKGDAGEVEGAGTLRSKIGVGRVGGIEFANGMIGATLTTTVEEEGGENEEEGEEGSDDAACDSSGRI